MTHRTSPWPWIAFVIVGMGWVWLIQHEMRSGSNTPSAPVLIGPSSDPALSTAVTMLLWTPIPSPTPTPSATPRPTPKPSPTTMALIDRYGPCDAQDKPGSLCVPQRPVPTPTEIAVCAEGFYPVVCKVPGETDETSARGETG